MTARVVIVGAGFGGLFAAKALARARADVVLIDRQNYHLFQPLLYQVATAGLAPSDIAWPIRSILTRQRNASVRLGEVAGVDRGAQRVELADGTIDYDYLVLATGARHAYFGHEEWREWAPDRPVWSWPVRSPSSRTARWRAISAGSIHAARASCSLRRGRACYRPSVRRCPTTPGVRSSGSASRCASRRPCRPAMPAGSRSGRARTPSACRPRR